jgi:Protein of unknown function (DUF4012)
VAIAAVVVAVLVVIAIVRYAPVLDDLRSVRESAQGLASTVGALGPMDLERDRVTAVEGQLNELDLRLSPVRDLVQQDPVIALARMLPVVGTQVRAADALVSASESLIEAGELGVGVAGRVVAAREASVADPAAGIVPELVEIMATSGDEIDRIAMLLEEATLELDSIPEDAVAQIREARELVRGPVRAYAPLIAAYRELDDVLPTILGRGEEARYLVLAQNPAELRPAGGYAGTVGIVAFRDGRIVEQDFTDVHALDGQEGLPFIEAPAPLRAHLLGEAQSWRLGDAAWSADFPTAARKALEFYELETGDADVDGVIALTTFALDRILEVTGPVAIDEFGTTVEPGDTTMTILAQTRWSEETETTRKDILDALAKTMMVRLMALPPDRWMPMLEALRDIGDERMAMAWFMDPVAQRLSVTSGWSGSLRQDDGDHLYVVEANMAPTSKYNLVVDRSDSVVIDIDEEGDAVSSLRMDWQNHAGEEGEPFASLRRYSVNQEGWYGAYVRVIIPSRGTLVTAAGRTTEEVRGVQYEAPEAGRTAFGNFLLMPPGDTTMSYLWTTPQAAVPTDGTWEYRLVVQKQPGARAHELAVRIELPDGATVVGSPAGSEVVGAEVRLHSILDRDHDLTVTYVLPEGALR